MNARKLLVCITLLTIVSSLACKPKPPEEPEPPVVVVVDEDQGENEDNGEDETEDTGETNESTGDETVVRERVFNARAFARHSSECVEDDIKTKVIQNGHLMRYWLDANHVETKIIDLIPDINGEAANPDSRWCRTVTEIWLDGESDLYEINPMGGIIRQLTNWPGSEMNPQLGWDNNLFFDDGKAVYEMDLSDLSYEMVTLGTYPMPAPDRVLAYTTPFGDLFVEDKFVAKNAVAINWALDGSALIYQVGDGYLEAILFPSGERVEIDNASDFATDPYHTGIGGISEADAWLYWWKDSKSINDGSMPDWWGRASVKFDGSLVEAWLASQ